MIRRSSRLAPLLALFFAIAACDDDSSTSPPPDALGSVALDGIDDYVQVPDDPALDLGSGDFTWEAWIGRSRTGVREDILTRKDVNAMVQRDVDLFIDSADHVHFFLAQNLTGGPVADLVSKSTVKSGWNHLAATRNQGRVILYINGVAEDTGTAEVDLSATGPLRIGANRLEESSADAGTSNAFAGKISEVKIWKVARSLTQITEALQKRPAGSTSGLVAYLPLNESEGEIATNRANSQLNGILRNGASWSPGTGPYAAP